MSSSTFSLMALFRFYAELNDLLSPERRFVTFGRRSDGLATVKDIVEGLGVPHTEIDLILVNGEPVEFTYRVRDDDRVSVYPVFESIDITPVARLRPEPLRETCFVLDTHLGRLAAYLRMLGFDTAYSNHSSDRDLARMSRDERRILLTRDRGLLKRSAVTRGHLIRETIPRFQMAEVVARFDLRRSLAPFTRCLRCNTSLEVIDKQSAASRVSRHAKMHPEFLGCGVCGRVYWRGSHYARMRRMIEETLKVLPNSLI